jgi:hypothetical protein
MLTLVSNKHISLVCCITTIVIITDVVEFFCMKIQVIFQTILTSVTLWTVRKCTSELFILRRKSKRQRMDTLVIMFMLHESKT